MKHSDVIIIGGGPAGCAAAATLASSGVRVVLLEKGRMPREKLCGEFITPECFPTLNRLGAMDDILAAGAQRIDSIRLVGANGNNVESSILQMSGKAHALSLSRSRFDELLFDRARRAGALCMENHAVKRCVFDDGVVSGVEALSLANGKLIRFEAPLVIDASGRNSRIAIRLDKRAQRGSRLFALKTHLKGVKGIVGQVELYFFAGGYGGLSSIEDGLSNLCFITNESRIKSARGDALQLLRQTLLTNSRANERMSSAEFLGNWVSSGPLVFGRRRHFAAGVVAIGDAAGMIDPFTGTGIQIALRSGELAAESVLEFFGSNSIARAVDYEASVSGDTFEASGEANGRNASLAEAVLTLYSARYEREFGKRMRIAGLLRSPAFSPRMASLFGRVLSASPRLARTVLRASRASRSIDAEQSR